MSKSSEAVLYRMATITHTCPYGLKTLHLLKRAGYRVDDRVLTSREETDAFKAQHQVRTTPQAFIDGTRIGGYEDVRAHLGKTVKDPQAPSYQDRKSTRLNSSHVAISYAVICLQKKNKGDTDDR